MRSLTPESDNAYNAWRKVLNHILEHGGGVEPRGQQTLEVLNQSIRIKLNQCIFRHTARGLNYRFAVAEFLWMLNGWASVQTLARYNPNMMHFSDDGISLAGAYGPRLKDQWNYIRRTLSDDWQTRQAVAQIWTANPEPSKDIPCTLSMQFLRRPENTLNVIVTMRSSDAWLGVPYDVFSFSMIARALASDLGLDVGELVLNMGSSHLYSKHIEQAKLVLDTPKHGASAWVHAPPGMTVPGQLNEILAGGIQSWSSTDRWAPFYEAIACKTSAEAWEAIKA